MSESTMTSIPECKRPLFDEMIEENIKKAMPATKIPVVGFTAKMYIGLLKMDEMILNKTAEVVKATPVIGPLARRINSVARSSNCPSPGK